MSTKYDPGSETRRIVRDSHGEIALTDHALHRYRERTPHDCQIGIREAWRRGETLQHPSVAGALDSPTPESARIYRHSDEWGVVFVVIKDRAADAGTAPDRAERVVVTVCQIRTYDSEPVRAYLHCHGPHGPEGER